MTGPAQNLPASVAPLTSHEDALIRARHRFSRNVLMAVGLLVILFGLNIVVRDVLDPYISRIVVLSGISIILAISLNLINGYTGQFSLGHAGFMAIGAYTAAALSYYYGNLRDPNRDAAMAFLVNNLHIPEGVAAVLFFAVIAYLGGVAASFAGLLVGVPTLRLKG